MAYVVGLAGVAAGTLVLREGDLAFAIILWTITFAVGAVLMGMSLLIRTLSGMVAQMSRMESDVRVLGQERAQRVARDGPEPERDPWLRH